MPPEASVPKCYRDSIHVPIALRPGPNAASHSSVPQTPLAEGRLLYTPKIPQWICASRQEGDCNKRCSQHAWEISPDTAVLQTRKWKPEKGLSKAIVGLGEEVSDFHLPALCSLPWALGCAGALNGWKRRCVFWVKIWGFVTKTKGKKKRTKL